MPNEGKATLTDETKGYTQGIILEKKLSTKYQVKTMKELFYGKTAIRFSLKNATKEMSLVRVRVNINGERLTYADILPAIRLQNPPEALGQRGRMCD